MANQLSKSSITNSESFTNAPILSVQGLGRKIQNQWLWQNLNFELLPGERVAVVGASGFGKSQLLRMIASLDPIQQDTSFFKENLSILMNTTITDVTLVTETAIGQKTSRREEFSLCPSAHLLRNFQIKKHPTLLVG
jgi:ABC-type glutathione transport system ATPase component